MRKLDEFAKPDNLDTKMIKQVMAHIRNEETSLNMVDQLALASPMIGADDIVPNLMS